MTLSQLWDEHPELFGNIEGDRFPLLIKIIDAKDNLSIQVHPYDEYAAKNENGSLGKTECWYILGCPDDAKLVVGHNAKTHEELSDMIHEGRWDEFIRYVPIKKGDFIQIDPGTVHAITSGCMILETQQNSDITYRVYDYDRLQNGKPRQLHVEQSIDVIEAPFKTADIDTFTEEIPGAVHTHFVTCKFYSVDKYDIDGVFTLDAKKYYTNVSVIAGEGTVNGIPVKKGTHFIIPANFNGCRFEGKLSVICSNPEA